MASVSRGAQPPQSAVSQSKGVLKKLGDFSFEIADAEPSASDVRRAKVAETLTGLYDKLNQGWVAIEEKLRSMLPPREAWVSYASWDEDYRDPEAGSIHACIGLVKYRGNWRICHGRYNDMHEPGPGSWKPIVECSVEERVAAVKSVDKLREEILNQAEKSIPKVNDAAAELAKALDRI